MEQVLLDKARLAELIDFLVARQKIFAPVALGHGQFKFAEVSSLAEMTLDYLPTILPPKKFVLPPRETLLEYDISEGGQHMKPLVEVEDLTVFGVHSCDLVGLQCLSMVFADHPRDYNHQFREKSLTLIGLECLAPCDHHAHCAMLNSHLPQGGYDLFFTELEESYFVDTYTSRGEGIVSDSKLFEPVDRAALKRFDNVRRRKNDLFRRERQALHSRQIKHLFETGFEHAVWDKIGRKCLSCGNCTNVCPTCYCFDISDTPELDLLHGRRVRSWDSCQHEGFALVAGAENFRKDRGDRLRHRFYRKFFYPLERYKRMFCTGCGRCSRSCMAGIDLLETVAALTERPG